MTTAATPTTPTTSAPSTTLSRRRLGVLAGGTGTATVLAAACGGPAPGAAQQVSTKPVTLTWAVPASNGGSTITDAFVFVKGNDLIGVSMYSARDDKLALVTQQTMSQYYFAPVSTIPSDQWPENANHGTSNNPTLTPPNLSRVAPFLLAAVAVLGVVAVAVGAFLRWRRWKRAPHSVALQMSPDGSHWWDGHTWRDSAREAPPFAQRSGDGGFWWDGHTWRPVPGAAVGAPATN